MKYFCLISILLLFLGQTNATVFFAEFDSFSGDVTSVTGNLNGNGFTYSIANQPGQTDFKIRNSSSIFDNSSSTFNNSFFTPPANNTDQLGMVMFSGTTQTGVPATLTITFANAVTGLGFHIKNMDRTDIDFSPTTTDVTRLSGSSDFGVSNGRLFDIVPTTDSDVQGSVQVNGTFSTYTIHLREVLNASDGYFIQFSLDDTLQQTIPEPSTCFLFALALMGFSMRFGKKYSGVK